MLDKVLDLDVGSTRTTSEAVGFYLISTVLLVGLSTVVVHFGHMAGLVGTVGTFFEGGGVHTMIGTVWVLFLSSMILTKKGLTGDLLSIVLTVVGLYLAFTTNVMLGMVPVALLTTLKVGK